MSHVDLHLHLLPGVDDGAPTLEDALRHAERLARARIHHAAVTPHVGHPVWSVAVAELPERMHAVQQAIDAARIPLRLHLGGELYAPSAAELSTIELETVALGPVGARWLLLEPPFSGVGSDFLRTAKRLHARGYGLVIAHPERSAGIREEGLARLRPLLRAGAVLQVNVCSLLGLHGTEAQTVAVYLVRNRLAHLLASDGHPERRRHTLADGCSAVRAAGLSAVQSWQLTQGHPKFLLEHGLPSPRPAHAGRAWISDTRTLAERTRAHARSRPPSRT